MNLTDATSAPGDPDGVRAGSRRLTVFEVIAIAEKDPEQSIHLRLRRASGARWDAAWLSMSARDVVAALRARVAPGTRRVLCADAFGAYWYVDELVSLELLVPYTEDSRFEAEISLDPRLLLRLLGGDRLSGGERAELERRAHRRVAREIDRLRRIDVPELPKREGEE